MPPTNPTNEESSTHSYRTLTTDDSGTIISMEEYASLHGETYSKNENRLLNIKKSIPLESRKTFKEIANLKEQHLPKQTKIRCIYCQKFIEKEKIKEHNNHAHPNEILFSPKRKLRSTNVNKQLKIKPDDFLAPEGKEGNIAEKLKQALDEARYGGKGMHHRHESDGKFGSTPLHDDYGDESDSD